MEIGRRSACQQVRSCPKCVVIARGSFLRFLGHFRRNDSSECAPVPVSRHACSEALRCSLVLLSEDTTHRTLCLACAVHRRCRRLFLVGGFAIRSTRSCNPPSLVIREAMLAGTNSRAFRMVVGVLVERDEVGRMHIAENVSTTSTVMPTSEVAEVSGAGSVVADR